MNGLDYGIITLFILSIGVGALRGAIREVLNIAGWVLAFILSTTYAKDLAALLAAWMVDPALKLIVAWLVIFLVVLIIISTLASLLSEITKKIGLGGLNRAVGALIGVLRGLVVLIALTLVAGLTRIPESSLWREAKLTPTLEIMAKYTRSILPDSIASHLHYRQPVPQEV